MTQNTQSVVQKFNGEWAKLHSDRQPIGWMLRKDQTLPWLRLHALPDSKRYAENDTELGVILSRANEIGNKLLGSEAPCWMIEARADQIVGTGEYAGQFAEDDDSDGMVWRYFVQSVDWQAGAFNRVLADIANDGPYYVVWMARNGGALFAPYDGGFDLFPSSLEQVETLKSDWSDWLSSHPEGL